MEREVKIGVAIGVLLIALVAIFWWASKSGQQGIVPPPAEDVEAALPPPVEPVPPTFGGLDQPVGPEVAAPALPAPGPTTDVPAAPPPAPAAPPAPVVRTHTVQEGENLYRIAKIYYGRGEEWQRIQNANKTLIPKASLLRPGMKLVIPELDAPTLTTVAITDTAAGTRKYTIQAGDSLSRISKKFYGTEAKWARIHKANKALIPDPNKLKKGVTIVIPAE